MPLAAKAPKLCPADPVKSIFIVLSGSPMSLYFLDISLLNIAPTDLSVFLIL